MYVLAVYGLVFGIMLPAVVGNWWYKSIQYTGDAVLIKTTKLFEVKTPENSSLRLLSGFWKLLFLISESDNQTGYFFSTMSTRLQI